MLLRKCSHYIYTAYPPEGVEVFQKIANENQDPLQIDFKDYGGPFTIATRIMPLEERTQFVNFAIVFGDIQDKDCKILFDGISKKKYDFLDWMNVEALRTAFPIAEETKYFTFSREKLIRRTAFIRW